MCESALALPLSLSLSVPEKGGSEQECRVRRGEEGYGGASGPQTVL